MTDALLLNGKSSDLFLFTKGMTDNVPLLLLGAGDFAGYGAERRVMSRRANLPRQPGRDQGQDAAGEKSSLVTAHPVVSQAPAGGHQ